MFIEHLLILHEVKDAVVNLNCLLQHDSTFSPQEVLQLFLLLAFFNLTILTSVTHFLFAEYSINDVDACSDVINLKKKYKFTAAAKFRAINEKYIWWYGFYK